MKLVKPAPSSYSGGASPAIALPQGDAEPRMNGEDP